ncbi:hypothetical protein [Candidatus Nanogingivalis gingivitcus]|jgi:hypothetical protein|uniref:Secreted protein n=1 Tax=Candidatus Nanogingivalis gingivitcus TaxID=2171992 RepID=A0ABY0FJJ5_9BACT|nr:hypothetical protein [Candidatus Nanogingivalis gingivitcus]RYC72996.1 hypothetical protein G6CMJM_00100 [Candidatus Nanogingivalis gingivitcus]
MNKRKILDILTVVNFILLITITVVGFVIFRQVTIDLVFKDVESLQRDLVHDQRIEKLENK